MSWDPYLDLQAGVLRNRLGLTDPEQLRRAEAGLTAVRLAQLAARPLPGHYDLEHLQAFHRLIFGEVYDWAGELRTVSLGKSALFCHPDRPDSPRRNGFRAGWLTPTTCAAARARRSSTG